MSVDHSTTTAGGDALFVHVKAGMSVVVPEGDTGLIRWVNADLVTHIVPRD